MTNVITPAEFITFAPAYAVVAGSVQALTHNDNLTVLILRLLQAILGTLTCGFVWRIAHKLTNDSRIAMIAGLGLALNPIFIIDNNFIATETLFLFFLTWALAVYVVPTVENLRQLASSGALLGLATLTRAQIILYPVGIVIHLALVSPIKRAWRGAVVLLLAYALVLSTWTVYNLVKFNLLVIGASGISDLMLAGAVGYKGAENVDPTYQNLANGTVPIGSERDKVAASTVTQTFRSNPIGYLTYRFKEEAKALLQPHATNYFTGKSLKAMVSDWLHKDRTLAGLIALTSGDGFWIKLVMYIFHFSALIFGVLGMILTIPEWRKYAPLSGLIIYILLLHFFMLVIPRYLFPVMPVLWVFAAVAMVKTWEWLHNGWSKRIQPQLPPVKIHNTVETQSDSVVS